MHQDTVAFANTLYADDDEIKYEETYTAETGEAYQKRVMDIYVPKVGFLLESLRRDGFHSGLDVLDIGSGAGHFAEALRKRNIKVRGLEISGRAVMHANRMMGDAVLHRVDYQELLNQIKRTSAPIATMIGVLEHLTAPREVLEAINQNTTIRYLYLVLPVVSLAIFLEMFFQQSFNRVLGGGHTHLYSRKSINHLLDEYGYESLSEWWFGADIPDFIRFGQMALADMDASDHVTKVWNDRCVAMCDALQGIVDQHLFCSEIHMIAKKKV